MKRRDFILGSTAGLTMVRFGPTMPEIQTAVDVQQAAQRIVIHVAHSSDGTANFFFTSAPQIVKLPLDQS